MSSGPLIREHGRVLNVADEQRGSQLSQDELSGATTIHLSDVADFNDQGGQVLLNGTVYTYNALDDTAETLHLTVGLAANVAQDTAVTITPAVYDRWALVRVDDAYDTAEGTYAVVPFGLYASLPPGQRDQEGEEWVTLVKDGNRWVVQDVRSDNTGLKGGAARDTVEAMRDHEFHEPGVLTVVTGDLPYFPPFPGKLVSVRAAVGTVSPSGSSIADVRKNGATVFTDPTHRPAIAVGDRSGLASAIDDPAFVIGDYFEGDWPQVGAGAKDGVITLGMCVDPGCYPVFGAGAPLSYFDAMMALAPLRYWRMRDTSGTTMVDSSGNGFDGTYYNAPTLNQASLLPTGEGASARFTAASAQYADVLDTIATRLTVFTIILVVKFASISQEAMIESTNGSGSRTQNALVTGLGGPANMAFFTQSPDSMLTDTLAGGPLTGTAYHLAMTCSLAANHKEFFRNGVSIATSTCPGLLTDSVKWVIANDQGASGAAHENPLDGWLQEVAVCNAILAPTQIAGLVAAGGF